MGSSASSSDCRARLFLFAAAPRLARAAGFVGISCSFSDVSGVTDCSDVFVLNTGDTLVVGVVVADVDAASLALWRVARAMA